MSPRAKIRTQRGKVFAVLAAVVVIGGGIGVWQSTQGGGGQPPIGGGITPNPTPGNGGTGPPLPPPPPPPPPAPPGGFGTGGSTATCSTSPCATGTTSTITVPTTDGAGKAVSWKSQIYVPAGMSGDAPLMVIMGGSIGTFSDQDWVPVANANRFIWMKFWCKPGCTSYSAYPDLGFPSSTCGPSSNAPCDDKVALKDTLDYVEANYPIDETKLYATGDSKGGSMTKDVMCGAVTNPLFRGYAPASSAFDSPTENTPITCSARGNGNRDFSIEYLWGTGDTFGLYTGANKVCSTSGSPIIEPGCQGTFGWKWAPVAGMTQLRTDYDCTSTSTATTFGATNKLVREVWDDCPVGVRAVASMKVIGGGHAFGGMNGVDGFDAGDEIYTWLSTH